MSSPSRTFAFGDIHGYSRPFERLIEEVAPQADDTVITLGDIIDGGPDSCGVIELLLLLEKRANLIAIRGNHEVMLARAAIDRTAIPYWLSFGGEATLDSYGAKSFREVPEWHWDFLDRLRSYHETESEIFVHGGLDPHTDLKNQTDENLYWRFFENVKPHKSGKRMICGHTPQSTGIPKHLGHATCLDTAITNDGWLTCLWVETNEYWQVNENGTIRQGQLELTQET